MYLTTYHIRANCRTGHERGVVPDDTIALTCGADVNLNGLHVVTIAWSDAAAGSIIDFSFVPFATEGRPAAACEKIVPDHGAPIEKAHAKAKELNARLGLDLT